MRILHTNDLHGKMTEAKRERLATLRKDADFYFDSGDCIKAGNMAVPLVEDPVWRMLGSLGCTASVPGNREFHITETGFRAKIAGCEHPILVANLRFKADEENRLQPFQQNTFALGLDQPFASGMVIDDVGVFGVMVPMVTARMSARHVSAFLNDAPVDAARRCVEFLREVTSTVICVSHIGLSNDVEMAATVPGIDLILGGHSHDMVDPPVRVDNTWVVQAGSHGRFAGMYDLSAGNLTVSYEPLP